MSELFSFAVYWIGMMALIFGALYLVQKFKKK